MCSSDLRPSPPVVIELPWASTLLAKKARVAAAGGGVQFSPLGRRAGTTIQRLTQQMAYVVEMCNAMLIAANDFPGLAVTCDARGPNGEPSLEDLYASLAIMIGW